MKTHLKNTEPIMSLNGAAIYLTCCGKLLDKIYDYTMDIRGCNCLVCLKSKEAGRQAVKFLTALKRVK